MEILWGEAPIYPCAASTLSGPRRRGAFASHSSSPASRSQDQTSRSPTAEPGLSPASTRMSVYMSETRVVTADPNLGKGLCLT
jgi:hypothetical protein